MKLNEIQDRTLATRKLLHTTVFAQCFSPCGRYIAAANNYGNIAIFSLSAVLSPEATDDSFKPIYTFVASEEGAIFCLASTDILLISAGAGNIHAWKWADILNKAPKQVWAWAVPKKNQFTIPEVNSIVVDQQEESSSRLFAGCGDNDVHVWDMEAGQQLVSLSGHEDYIHCVATKNKGRECVSASEDGTIRIWDSRTEGEAVHIIEPYKQEICARPEFGKWLGCVAMDPSEDWLVCGGGPQLSLWHLRSINPTTTFDTPGATQKHVMFYEDAMISAGSKPLVHHWYINGDLKSEVPCTPTSVFNVSINTNSDTHKVLCVAGNSAKIDVCTNFGYRASSLIFTQD
ncbi:hypothetical protein ScPMuIL_006378 [Solemya velum]